MKLPALFVLLTLLFVLPSSQAEAQAVLGPCGQTEGAGKLESSGRQQEGSVPGEVKVSRVPLPGERAIDFELTAVVGDEIKKVRLSDYQGMYRVLCFYPADFTFV